MTPKSFLLLVVLSLLVLQCFGGSVFTRSSFPKNAEGSNTAVEICMGNAPCGWAVYARFTRIIDYYLQNACVCPEEKKCVRTDDDISVAAYVYRCRDRKPKDMNSSSSS